MAIPRKIAVCYFGTYRAEYTRNQILIEGLKSAGIQVLECHETLWTGVEDRVAAASGGWRKPAFLGRTLRTYARLLSRYRKIGRHDLLIVGYPGQIDVYLARLLSWMNRRPLVWDVYGSIFLISNERQLNLSSRFTIRMLGLVERTACLLPDLLVLDTLESIEWFSNTYNISTSKFVAIPNGADNRYYRPGVAPDRSDGIIRVVYFGSFIPNHGVNIIIEAANLLAGRPDIQFILIGDGPEQEPSARLVQKYNLNNVRFIPWLEKTDLVVFLQQADIILGSFADRPQSRMTVHNKIFEGMAIGKPVISRDSPAIRRVLEDQVNVFLCQPENPHSLADAIIRLVEDFPLRQRLSDNGLKFYNEQFNQNHIGRRFADYLERLLEAKA